MKTAIIHIEMTEKLPTIQGNRFLQSMNILFSRASPRPRESNLGLPHCRQIIYRLSHQGSPVNCTTKVKTRHFLGGSDGQD